MVFQAMTGNTKTASQGAPLEPVDICRDLADYWRANGGVMAKPEGPAPPPSARSEDAGNPEIGSEAVRGKGKGGGRRTSYVVHPPRKGGMDPDERMALRYQRPPPPLRHA